MGPVDGSSDAIGQLEQALIGTTRTLLEREQHLSANARELERAKAEAEAASKAKGAFVATISHEIRSPMNALLGVADLLATTELSGKQLEYVGLLNRAGNNLMSVINEVLDHAKIEAGRMELECVPFDCAALVERVVELLSVSASQKGLDLLSKYTRRRAPVCEGRLQPVTAGAGEPGVERHQVHGDGGGGDPGRAGRQSGHAAFFGGGHGDRNPTRQAGCDLPEVHAGRVARPPGNTAAPDWASRSRNRLSS